MYKVQHTKEFAAATLQQYLKSQTVPLSYNDFRANAFNLMYSSPGPNNVKRIENDTLIRIAPSTQEMLKQLDLHAKELEDIQLNAPAQEKDFKITCFCKELFKPKLEFTYTPPMIPIEYKNNEGKVVTKDTPMWFNTTMKGINVRLGYDNGDSATPSAIVLGDNVVHMMLGGATGAGKSVALNTVLCNLIVEYAPWELDIYLGDFKKVEGARYANRISTPHMKIVAATGSTEFILSTYQELIKEMNDRQALFAKTGVQKVEDFRNKFGLVMPRVLLIVDEFTQMYENIKTSEEQGNESAAEDKKAVDSALSGIARLGRSMGIHMCLSSQQLDNLDSGVANQFAAGATLKAPPGVSTALIGNDAGSSIRGKGKGYYNCNKTAKNPEDNVLVRIPFLQSEQTEEEAAAGKLTNLHEILFQADTEVKKIGYNKGLTFYDEDAPIPAQKYKEALKYCEDFLAREQSSSEVSDITSAKRDLVTIPLGPEIKLSEEPTVLLRVSTLKNNSVVVHATNESDKYYMLKLLYTGIDSLKDNVQNIVVNGDETTYLSAGLNELPNLTTRTRPVIPEDLMGKIQTRNILLELQSIFKDTGDGNWNDVEGMTYIASIMGNLKRDSGLSIETLASLANKVRRTQTFDGIEELEGDSSDIGARKLLVNAYNSYYLPFHALREGGDIVPQRFGLTVIWLIGLDEFTNITDSEVKRNIKYLLSVGPTVGVLPIVTANVWTNVGGLVEDVNFILERTDKKFFTDISLPKAININVRSFQLHNRNLKTRNICSQYSGLV